MFDFFLNILRQKSGRYVCVQLLQTLNILFENISHETSLCEYSRWHVTIETNWRSSALQHSLFMSHMFCITLSPDYLLSNNHVNSIIVHKFDFSDEEIMAYYISFLKTLSLKLNNHTVHFFYNEVRCSRPLCHQEPSGCVPLDSRSVTCFPNVWKHFHCREALCVLGYMFWGCRFWCDAYHHLETSDEYATVSCL